MWWMVGLTRFRRSLTPLMIFTAVAWLAVAMGSYSQEPNTATQAAILELPSADNITFDDEVIRPFRK
jgi:hypothetical protein